MPVPRRSFRWYAKHTHSTHQQNFGLGYFCLFFDVKRSAPLGWGPGGNAEVASYVNLDPGALERIARGFNLGSEVSDFIFLGLKKGVLGRNRETKSIQAGSQVALATMRPPEAPLLCVPFRQFL